MTPTMERSVLNPEPQSLALPILVALMAHVFFGSTLVCMSYLQPKPAPILEDHAMDVSLTVLPRSQTRMPERAQRAPRTAGEVAPAKAVEEQPLRESDLTFPQKDTKPKEGTSEVADAREAALRKLLLEDIDAPEGEVDRNASDPNSDSDEAINMGTGAAGDQELARYIDSVRKLFMANFAPLPALVSANPGLKCTILVRVDPETGAVTGYEIVKSSGNESFDKSAEAAVQAVPNVPLPPEKYREGAKDGYRIVFTPK